MKRTIQILFSTKSNFLWIAFTMMSFLAHGQGTITGTISDEHSETLPGVNVFIEGTTIGGTSNFDGVYSINNLDEGSYTIIATFVGYKSAKQEVTVTGGEVTLDFQLIPDLLELDAVVVTGVVNPKSKMESSVSITTLSAKGISQSSPQTTAEIFRTIPGIRAEASGGDGNTNITVRGVPISAGGSKYLQLQEDGLPVLSFGDIAFATSDIFLRFDQNLARVEAIRGGSASTQSSNSPAGIINFISKTGNTEGGSLGTTVGMNYNSFRTDFDYGAPIGNGLNFHVGGFYRQGEGPRKAGYLANKGGQFKANLTKNFKNGYARVYYKMLNDRAAAYMPMPIQVSGTNANPTWESVPGFDAVSGVQHSPYMTQNFGIGPNGERRNVNVSDGMHPISQSIGAEFVFDLENDWTIENRARLALNSGRFVAPFTAAVGTTSNMLTTVGDAINRDLTGASLAYAHNGQAYNNSNGLAQVIHMFDTELNDFNNFVNDFKVSKSLGNVQLTAGYFKSSQNINMSWLWNSYLMEVNGEDGGLLDITQSGTQITEGGQYAYGVPVWGNCCQSGFNTTYDISAPYAAVAVDINENISVDASYRWDKGFVQGSTQGGTQATLDVNNDGTISPIEESVSVIDNSVSHPVDYTYSYSSYSIGANMKLDETSAVFGRLSKGASAKADRILSPGSPLLSLGNPKDVINQFELGYKKNFSFGGLFVTGFMANTTEEGGFEASTQQVIENDYKALGVEIESAFSFGNFDVRSAITYTNAEITSGDDKGNTPRRQPKLMYNLIPTYSIKGGHSLGLSFIGQGKGYAQNSNELVMPGYNIVNAFVTLAVTDGFTFSLNANNLTNTIGITESEEGSITEGQVNYIRARSISGRTLSATLRFKF